MTDDPPTASAEGDAARSLVILFEQSLEASWYEKLLMTDASYFAGAVIEAKATPEEPQMESRFALRGGSLVS